LIKLEKNLNEKQDILNTSSYDEYGLLERVAGYLKIQCKSIPNIKEYGAEIIKKICQSLQSGSIVFIEINKWDCLQSQESIIPWFVDNFWIPLIQESKIFIKEKELRRVKFVTVIDLESQLSTECNNLPYYCCGDSFDYQKILKLPLNQWQQDDIQEWLEIYTGLSASKIDAIARNIYLKTMNGIPYMVCGALEQELNQKLTQ
jgi:inactive STAND